MSELRWVGLLVSAGLIAALVLYRRKTRRPSRFTFILSLLVCLAVGFFALFPDALNEVFLTFDLRPGNNGRLVGLLMLSNLLVFIFIFILAARNDALKRTLDRLMTALTKQAFEGQPSGAPIVVVIPAYEEEQNIGLVLSRMPKEVCGLRVEVVVVVDGGRDRTAEVVRSHNTGVATHIINRGQGAALRVGYELAIEHGAQIVVTMDADNQHNPAEIENVVRPILENRADFVVGSRVLGRYEKDSHVRALGVVLFNWLLTLMTGTRITDCSSGFRAIRAACLKELKLVQSQYQTTEMLLEVLRHNYRFLEVPITIHRRAHGESKKGPTLVYALGFLRTIVVTWLR